MTDSIDPDKVKATVERVFGYLSGAMVSGMIYLGEPSVSTGRSAARRR